MAGGGGLGDVLHRGVLRAGVVLGDPHQRGGEDEPHGAGAEEAQLGAGGGDGVVGDDLRGDEPEGGQRQDAGDGQPLVQRGHDVGHAGGGADEEAADDGGDDRDAAQREGVHDRRLGGGGDHQRAQHHGGDEGDGVGLEEVGRHAGAVADVIADVVGDHGGVARVVLGDPGLDLAHQVGADVGALGEDAAAEAGEDGDEGGAEGEADEGAQGGLEGGALRARHEVPGEAGDAEEAEADDEHAGDGAAAEGDGERRGHAAGGGLGGADVGAHRDVHPDEAAGAREHRAQHEADGGVDFEGHGDDGGEDDADDADGLVLARQVGGGAGLDGTGDVLHARVAGILGEDPAAGPDAIGDGHQAADERQPEGEVSGHEKSRQWGGVRGQRLRLPR